MAIIGTTEYFENAYTEYNRAWAESTGFALYKNALTQLTSRSDYTPSTKVLFIGCGFGYWIQYLLTIPGVNEGNVWGIDNGPHVNANKTDPIYCDPVVAAKVLNLDIFSPSILNDLKPYYGGNGKVSGWLISTLVLSMLETDQELTNFVQAVMSLGTNQAKFAHIFASEITPESDPEDVHDRALGMVFRPRDYYPGLFPTNYFVDVHGWNHPEVRIGGFVYGLDYFGVYDPVVQGWR